MKILICSSVFYPAIGGIENLTLFLSQEFVKAGHQVKVITGQKQDKPLDKIEVVRTRSWVRQMRLFLWCDVFFMPNITLKGVWLMGLNFRRKWVISHNDFHLMHSGWWKANLKMFFIKKAHLNIAVSQSVSHSLKVDSRVIYNCYDDDVFKIYPGIERDIDFVFVGRLVSQKGCSMLLDALALLGGNYTLSIIGDGAEMTDMQIKAQALGLADRVMFTGFLGHEELAMALGRHKVMVVPSVDLEGFGIVALEGLACGCELIVSDAGGLPEAIVGQGRIFPMGDVEKLTELMREIITSKDLNKMDADRTKFLEEHSKAATAKRYLEAFRQLLKRSV